MKTILTFVIKTFFKNTDYKIKIFINKFLDNNKINLLDIGAAGGINNRWDLISNKLNITLVEPNVTNAKLLEAKKFNVIKKCFYKEENKKIILLETKDKFCSSLLKPNKDYLKNYYKTERYDLMNEIHITTTTIDNEYKEKQKPDFIKIDTEGSGLNILHGAEKTLKEVLGIEIECVFNELRINQPKFEEIKNYLEHCGFIFIDFLHITRWEKNQQRSFGQPQITDCLFLKDPSLIINYAKNKIDKKNNFIKYISILLIYNRTDILYNLINNSKIDFIEKKKLNAVYKYVEKKIKFQIIFERALLFIKNIINYQI